MCEMGHGINFWLEALPDATNNAIIQIMMTAAIDQ